MSESKLKVVVPEDGGKPYVEVEKEVHGQIIKVKVYGELGKRPKQFCR